MELKSNCKVLLDKGTRQKVPCCKFFHEELGRELAVHANVDHKHLSSITDVATGLRMCGLDKSVDKVKIEDVIGKLDSFLKHFTVEETLKEFARIEQ